MPDLTRQCASCEESKTVNGLWYLVATGPPVADPSFYCETCFISTAATTLPGLREAAAPTDRLPVPDGPGSVVGDLRPPYER